MSEVFIISGNDSAAVKKRAKELASSMTGGDYRNDPALEMIDGDGAEASAVLGAFLDAVRTPPFLSPFKVVWMRNFSHVKSFDGGDAMGDAVLEFFKTPLPPDVNVVIDVAADAMDMRSRGAKALKALATGFETLNAPKSTDKNFALHRREVLDAMLADAGVKIEPAAANFLFEAVGGDSGNFRNEVEKLITSIGERDKITLADAQDVISRTPEALSWELGEAVFAGDRRKALRVLDLLLRSNEAAVKILYMLSAEFQRILETKCAMKRLGLKRVGPNTFSSLSDSVKSADPDNPLLKYHPYRAFKMCEKASSIPDSAAAEKLELLTRSSIALVSSGGDQRMVLERLIIKLTGS